MPATTAAKMIHEMKRLTASLNANIVPQDSFTLYLRAELDSTATVKMHFVFAALLFSPCARAHPNHAGEPATPSNDAPVFMKVAATAGKNQVSITIEGDYRVIKANGLPDHTPRQ